LELVRVVVEYLSFARVSCVKRERERERKRGRKHRSVREREKAFAALTALLIVVFYYIKACMFCDATKSQKTLFTFLLFSKFGFTHD